MDVLAQMDSSLDPGRPSWLLWFVADPSRFSSRGLSAVWTASGPLLLVQCLWLAWLSSNASGDILGSPVVRVAVVERSVVEPTGIDNLHLGGGRCPPHATLRLLASTASSKDEHDACA